MSFPYKKILLIGATSGIGLTLAERFVQNGHFVIAAGRRKENLEAFVQKQGQDRTAAVQFDISKLDLVPEFAANIMKSHPDIDCVFINAGMQRRSVFSEPETVDMSVIIEETTVNYLSYVALAKEFLPFFLAKKDQPMAFILVVELYPPIVQTELHDEKHQPDIKGGRSFGISLNEFANEAMGKLLGGLDQVPVGLSNMAFNSWEQDRQKAFANLTDTIRNLEH